MKALREMRPDWERDGIQLYCADCMDVLPHLSGVDAVVTDPPYGISHKSNGQWFKDALPIHGDESVELGQAVIEWALHGGLCVCAFCSPYAAWRGKFRNWLAWEKGDHVGIGGDRETCWKRTFELIAIANNPPLNGQRDGAVVRFNALLPPPSGHFCEKPLALMEYLIGKLSQRGQLILDPFMGSGTTGVACVRLGRRFIGIERERQWFSVAVDRIERALSEERSSLFPVAKEIQRELI